MTVDDERRFGRTLQLVLRRQTLRSNFQACRDEQGRRNCLHFSAESPHESAKSQHLSHLCANTGPLWAGFGRRLESVREGVRVSTYPLGRGEGDGKCCRGVPGLRKVDAARFPVQKCRSSDGIQRGGQLARPPVLRSQTGITRGVMLRQSCVSRGSLDDTFL